MSHHDTEAFRARYRAGISRFYQPWLHGGFVLVVGALLLAWLISRVDGPRAWEWLAVPAGLLFFSWGEYTVHRRFGHHKQRLGALFYKRHTGDHHSFFADGLMAYQQARDWRVILFPAWLILVFGAGLVLPAYGLLAQLLGHNVGALFAATLLAGYLGYEFFHACQHLPTTHPLASLPWILETRRLHELHHRRELMQQSNFNLVFPLMDWLRGSLHWEPIAAERPSRMTTSTTHTLLRASPQAAYDYLTRPGLWHEWHKASLGTEDHALAPMRTGDRFREQIRTVGIRKELFWVVLDARPAQRWEASAAMSDGSSAQLVYEFAAVAEGTRFTRSLSYSVKPWPLRLLNGTVGWAKVRLESRQALRRLQRRFEQQL